MPPVMFRLPHHLTTKTPPSFDEFFFDLDSKHVNKAYKELKKQCSTYLSTNEIKMVKRTYLDIPKKIFCLEVKWN